jgi:hypothetical protein
MNVAVIASAQPSRRLSEACGREVARLSCKSLQPEGHWGRGAGVALYYRTAP